MNPKEHEWFLLHPEVETEYPGQYIAIRGDRVVSHGVDFGAVLREAEKEGLKSYIHKVPVREKALIV